MLQDNGEEEDFCSACLNVVYNIDEWEPKQYVFEDITETYYESESDGAKRVDYQIVVDTIRKLVYNVIQFQLKQRSMQSRKPSPLRHTSFEIRQAT